MFSPNRITPPTSPRRIRPSRAALGVRPCIRTISFWPMSSASVECADGPGLSVGRTVVVPVLAPPPPGDADGEAAEPVGPNPGPDGTVVVPPRDLSPADAGAAPSSDWVHA